MSSNFTSLFEFADQMGVRPSLNFKSQSTSKSICGGIITILLSILAIGSTILFGRELIYKQKPNVIISKSIDPTAPRVPINAGQDLRIAIGMVDPFKFQPFVDLSLYGAKAYFYGTEKDEFMFIEMNMTICTKEQAGTLTEAIGNAWCLEDNDQIDVIVEDWKGQGLFYSLYTCDEWLSNKTGVPCADNVTISQAFESAFVQIYYTQLAVNPRVLEEPTKYQSSGSVYSTNVKGRVTSRMILKEVSMETDTGLYFEDTKSDLKYEMTQTTPEQENYELMGFFNVYLLTGNEKVSYERSYKKIQDIVAEINGFVVLAFILAKVLCNIHLENNFYEKVIKDSFQVSLKFPTHKQIATEKQKFNLGNLVSRINQQQRQSQLQLQNEDLDKSSNNNNDQTLANDALIQIQHMQSQAFEDPKFKAQEDITNNKRSDEFVLLNINTNSKGSQNPLSTSQNGGQNPQNQSQKQSPRPKLSISFVEWIATYIPKVKFKAKLKSQLLQKGKSRIDRHLDISYIIKKLQEIEKLKTCLLTHDQAILFDGLPKPVLELTEDGQSMEKLGHAWMMMHEDNEHGREKLAQEAYLKIQLQESKTKTDENLLKIYQAGISRHDNY